MPSYCHPWSSGVTAYLSKFTLGLSPLSPGYLARGYLATPHVSTAHPHVGGRVPTPHGSVALEASWDDASCTATVAVEAPAALGGAVGLPRRHASRRRRNDDDDDHDSEAATTEPTGPLLGGRSDGGRLQLHSLTVDGAAVPTDAFVPPVELPAGASAEWHAWRHRHHAHTPRLSGGRHVVRATYAPCAASAAATTNNGRGDHEAKGDARAPQQPLAPLFPPPMYPVAEGTIDTATRGDWVGRYGTAGYALFAFSNGTDVVHIPKSSPAVLAGAGGGGGGGGGLQNISFFHAPQRRFSGCLPGSNATALERPPTLTPVEARAKAEKEQNELQMCARALGVATMGGDGSQGVVVDVRFATGAVAETAATTTAPPPQPRKYRVAVYMVGATASQAIRVMDLDTLNVVSPTPHLTAPQLETGAYYVLETDRSLRLRLMSTHNDNTISAVFVDPAW